MVHRRVSSWRLDSCSLRSTDEAWVSTVFTLMNSSRAISFYASGQMLHDLAHSRAVS